VGAGESFSDFDREIQRACRDQGPARYEGVERLAAEQLHRDVRDALRFANFVDDGDVGML
jgi:hypothetical protein